MLSKISRNDCLADYPMFPVRDYDEVTEEETFFYPEIFQSYILTLPSKTFKGHATILAKQVRSLARGMNWDKLIILGDTPIPWLDGSGQAIGHICKYGNLHLDTLNNSVEAQLTHVVGATRFQYGDQRNCYNWHSKSQAIKGRRIQR